MVTNLEKLLSLGFDAISKFSEEEMSYKKGVDKWSKKEILGHLIDSAVNNLQRFTEIQFSEQPYQIRNYNQVALVSANDYQNSEAEELLNFWLSINTRIKEVIKRQTDKTLSFKVKVNEDTIVDLSFLIEDYINHINHHLQQITN